MCDRKWDRPRTLNPQDPLYLCNFCGKGFHNKQSLAYHEWIRHKVEKRLGLEPAEAYKKVAPVADLGSGGAATQPRGRMRRGSADTEMSEPVRKQPSPPRRSPPARRPVSPKRPVVQSPVIQPAPAAAVSSKIDLGVDDDDDDDDFDEDLLAGTIYNFYY